MKKIEKGRGRFFEDFFYNFLFYLFHLILFLYHERLERYKKGKSLLLKRRLSYERRNGRKTKKKNKKRRGILGIEELKGFENRYNIFLFICLFLFIDLSMFYIVIIS